jgi:PAS domain S-box-containing protein
MTFFEKAMQQVTDRLKTPAKQMTITTSALQNAIFNSANFSSIATDVNGVIQIFNVGAENMLGYSAAEVMNIMTPAELSDAGELILRADALSLKVGTVITPGFEALVFKAARGIEDIYELTYIRKDGSRFPAVVSVTALRDDNDNIIGYLLIGTDNTARKLAEEALRKAGALQNAIFNSANFSSIATDVNGVIQIFNVGAENMLGYSAAEVMNIMTPAELSDAGELILRADALSLKVGTVITPGFEALVFKAARGIEDIYELTYIRKDGSRFPAVVSVTALRDDNDNIIGYLLIGTDNTARKLAEQGMRIAAVAFETAQGMFITDANGLFVHVNQAFSAMTGYVIEELVGKNPSIMKSGRQNPAFYAAMWASISTNGTWSGEIWNRKKNGEIYLELLTIVKVTDDQDSTTHYVATFTDITKQKEYEASLIVAKERAEHFLQLKSEFIASMSHEIRTPMAAIIGFSELALLMDTTDKVRTYLKNINTASTSLMGILNDILDFSKLEAGRLVVDAIPFNVKELLDTIDSIFAGAAVQKGIDFTIEVDSLVGMNTPVKLIGDKLRLQQVLINLVGNAIKFTAQGAVKLKITLQQINLSQVRMLCCVSDTGIGIAENDQSKLFKSFSQVDGSITRKYGGTGLGLAISKQLLELMGGEFFITSTVGLGSSFSFELLMGIQPCPMAKSPSLSMQHLSGSSVLLVEDNVMIQVLVQDYLVSSGIIIDIANNGEEALAMLAQSDYSTVLMDIHMPVMNGIKATTRIRNQPRLANLPVIALTAGATVEEREQCLACGMNDFISKPIDLKKLLCVLEFWMKMRAS